MTKVNKIRVKNRLAKCLATPGGLTAHEALKRAQQGIDLLKGPCLEMLDAALAEMDAKYGPRAPDRDGRGLEELYSLASRIIDVAICLDGGGVDLAARSLCDLADLSMMRGVCDWEAIEVHIDTLRLLRAVGQSMPPDQRERVLTGLVQVTRKRVGDPAAAVSAVGG